MEEVTGRVVGLSLNPHSFNPFASIGHTGTSKGKVKVRDICQNISSLT